MEGNTTDLIELMTCKNCKHAIINSGGGLTCSNRVYKINPDGTKIESLVKNPNDGCSSWDKKDESNQFLDIYLDLVQFIKGFVDTKEENYQILALWIIGTWLHDSFQTYPYLFINAQKGSGKTRLLKIIKELSKEGDMLASLSEAVLFRTTGTLCIDEFEGISGKDKNALRELLNTAYKKGGKVKRMRKKKTFDGEQQVVEEFNTFRPIAMANISGLDEVLGDRCIPIILEKSNKSKVTRKIEDFDENIELSKIKANLVKLSVCRLPQNNVYRDWNRYIDSIDTHIHTLTLPTQTYTHPQLFEKIYETNIDGRNLELSFPLLMIADKCGILESVIETMKETIQEKREEDVMAGKDIAVLEVVSKQENDWIKIRQLVTQMSMAISYDSSEDHWLRPEWMSKALKRLNLILKKRRLADGMEVLLNTEKAKQKMEMFK